MTYIAEAELKNPFIATDKLPAYIQNFVRWQQEVAGLDGGLIDAVANPDLIEGEKYIKAGEISKGRKRMSKAWKRSIEEALKFIQEILSILTKNVDANLEYLDQLEQVIDDSIEAVAEKEPEKAEELKVIKNEVIELKERSKKQKNNLDEMAESDPPPTKNYLKKFANTVSDVSAAASQATINLYNKMRPIQQVQQTAQSFAAAEAVIHSFTSDQPEETSQDSTIKAEDLPDPDVN